MLFLKHYKNCIDKSRTRNYDLTSVAFCVPIENSRTADRILHIMFRYTHFMKIFSKFNKGTLEVAIYYTRYVTP